MKEEIKRKLEGKSAYLALALLLTLIIVFTVIAIVASVNSQEEPVDPPVSGEQPPEPSGDEEAGGDSVTEPDADIDADVGTDTEVSQPEAPVYLTPCQGYIQKDYSSDTLVFSQTMNDHRIHLGVDISGNLGDPVKAFCKGVIEKVFNDRFMGKTIVLDHGSGLKSVYMNLSDTLPDGIKEGVSVEAGTVIGAIGETALNECADSPHLHFEVILDGKKVDPKSYVTLPSSSENGDIYEG